MPTEKGRGRQARRRHTRTRLSRLEREILDEREERRSWVAALAARYEAGGGRQELTPGELAAVEGLEAWLTGRRPGRRRRRTLREILQDLEEAWFAADLAEARALARLPRRLKDPVALKRLSEMAAERKCSPDTLLRQHLLPTGLLLADDETPRKIRLGRRWVRGPDGRVAPLRPCDLPRPDFFEWLFAEAIGITTGLLHDPTCTPGPIADVDVDRLPSPGEEGALDALIAEETIRTARAVGSPRERELLEHVLAGADPADLPALMDLSPQAVHTLRKRLAKKNRDRA